MIIETAIDPDFLVRLLAGYVISSESRSGAQECSRAPSGIILLHPLHYFPCELSSVLVKFHRHFVCTPKKEFACTENGC
ncbi:hypothetical protein TNCV_1063811 [Trichonephila clavipes]|nr:hypothetical protein TNCV_1063811 [Trichonephila clavipes]